ncbi:phosphomevalonate kinase [Sporosarcina thermotolerans]|uniref:phosphomevalonate kinase n=1 Tax=Sporosarcina thermotolerans TaxID=633404 RepID=UPI0024BC4C80|nr:phosphomevalonate kinase [Sporosarcina thermotolerans]WHT47212.1 phosphomevalonate kinase [Sporosarcina thermotolerans]
MANERRVQMDTLSNKIRVPGKLFIAGEFAVLEPDGQCIVVAVDRYVFAEVKRSEENRIDLPQIGYSDITWNAEGNKLTFNVTGPKLNFIQNTIEICHQYILESGVSPLPFNLSITSELDDASGKKYGLGSSAAVVVAVVTAILQSQKEVGIHSSKELIFKLAAMAHFKTQGNGSCADIAASTYGGWLLYSPFYGEWLNKRLQKKMNAYTLVNEHWPGLIIQAITPPKDLRLYIGWTGSEMRTAGMIRRVQDFKNTHPDAYQDFLETSGAAVSSLVKSFTEGDIDRSLLSLMMNRNALMQISDQADAGIETLELKQLIEIANKYGVGKTSGAGGGDCGIAFIKNGQDTESLKNDWKEALIEPLDLRVSTEGATVIGKGKK